MSSSQSARASLCDVLRTLVRHRTKIVCCFVLVWGAAWVWLWLAPRTYASVAKLYVRMGRENVTLDPTATTGQTVNLYQTRESEINSALQILESQGIAEQVVDYIGADVILANSLRAVESDLNGRVDGSESARGLWSAAESLSLALGRAKQLAMRLLPEDGESDRSRALRKLQSRTTIWSPINSCVIAIECRAGDPRLAQQIAATWTTIFLREDLRLTRTQGSHDFFSREVDSLARQLADAERELREAKDGAGLVSIAGQQKILEEQASAIRSQRTANRSSLEAAKAKVREMEVKLSGLSPTIVIQDMTGLPHMAWDRMREQLYELQIRERELRSVFTMDHPSLKAVQSQREQVQAILESQPDSRTQSTMGPNPTHHAALQSYLLETSAVAALVAESAVFERYSAELQQEFLTLNERATRIAELERNVSILDGNYRDHMNKFEQTRIHTSLDEEGISSINVLQPATYMERPSNPGKRLTLAVGLVLAVGSSIGLAFTAEYLNTSFVTVSQVEATLALPVLANIPRASTRALRFELRP